MFVKQNILLSSSFNYFGIVVIITARIRRMGKVMFLVRSHLGGTPARSRCRDTLARSRWGVPYPGQDGWGYSNQGWVTAVQRWGTPWPGWGTPCRIAQQMEYLFVRTMWVSLYGIAYFSTGEAECCRVVPQ